MPVSRRQFIKGGLVVAGMAASGLAHAGEGGAVFPAHAPIGKGVGIFPGRVVWVHEPASVKWNGQGYWWQPENFDPAVIRKMIQYGLDTLTGEKNPALAWRALFAWHNAQNGMGGGYQAGQKLAIKPNMNGAAEYDDDPGGNTAESYGNSVLLRELLLSLVKEGGVQPGDITIFDTCRIFPDYMIAMCGEGLLAGINFRHRNPGGPLDSVEDANAQIHWAGNINGEQTFLPACVTEASYLINLANVKGNSWGMTLGAKNHFGSFVNKDRMRTPQAAGLHSNIIGAKMGDYSALTQLMADRRLGGKTILWILDGLITTPCEVMPITFENSIWKMAPFNSRQMASLFFSQDPVAIDSVGADFLVNEPIMLQYNSDLGHNHGMENYLHEAALLPTPPSTVNYPDGLKSLGVHEHWNNPTEKLYGRNLGGSEGIELVKAKD